MILHAPRDAEALAIERRARERDHRLVRRVAARPAASIERDRPALRDGRVRIALAREDRRLELCGNCGSYLKTIDVDALSPFPLVTIGDLETMELDAAAMEHGFGRPSMKEFPAKR